MIFKLTQCSVVVLANDHNPTILNPDFLEVRGIIPKDWGWKMNELPISTPPFAIVSYDSGVTVTVEPNKFQVVDQLGLSNPENSKITDIAKKYVEVLPHVRYGAVGLNFQSFLEMDNANEFLKTHFIKAGPWDDKTNQLTTVNLTLDYPLNEGILRLSLEGGELVSRAEEKETHTLGIIANANFHRKCEGYPSEDQALQHLNNLHDDGQRYQKLLSDIFDNNNA